MNYTHIIDRLKHFEFDLNEENQRFYSFILGKEYSLTKIIDEYFMKFPLRGLCSNYGEFINIYYYDPYRKSKDPLNDYLLSSDLFLNIKIFLNSLTETERIFVDNVFSNSFVKDINLMSERALYILSVLGYKPEVKDKYAYIIKSNIEAEIVAEKVENTNLKWKIIEFNKYDIKIEEKINILEDMYKEFENIRNQCVDSISNKIAKYMNTGGIRHLKENKVDEELKSYIETNPGIYDVIYQMMIECFLHVENLKSIKNIENALKKI